jgi:hypothetical protein
MQGSHSNWFVAMTVMVIGVIVALPFHREAPEPSEDAVDFSHFSEGLIWQESTYSPDSAAAVSHDRRLGPLHRDREVAAVAASEWSPAGTPPPPRMEGEYGGLAEKFRVPTASRGRGEPAGRWSDSDFASRSGLNEFALRSEPSRTSRDPVLDSRASGTDHSGLPMRTRSLPQVAANVETPARGDQPVTPPRLHRIVDGDTLASLAARYLGDPGRAGEIFRANQEGLVNPDLLPVGKQLRIPSSSLSATRP